MNNKNKNILLGVLVVGVLSMTIAFAALSTRLNISGTANVAEAKWDIHFESWSQDKPQNNLAGVANKAVETTAATITETAQKGTLISGLVVSLAQPGDTISYRFNIVNDGTMVGLLDSFNKTISATVANSQTTANTNDLEYTVVCGAEAQKGSQALGDNPAEPIATDTIAAGNARACKLTISYKVQTNNNTAGEDQTYTGQARTVTLGASWTWVQGNAQSNNQQGGGSNTPSNPYLTTFDGTYGYDFRGAATSGNEDNPGDSEWVSELDEEVTEYFRYDGTKIEACGVFSGGTVCLTSSYYLGMDDFSDYFGIYANVQPTTRPRTQEEINDDWCNDDYPGPDETLCYICPENYELDSYDESVLCNNHGEYVLPESGYVKAKVDEIESKGATCTLEYNYVNCIDEERGTSVGIKSDGTVEAGLAIVNPDGSACGGYGSCNEGHGIH